MNVKRVLGSEHAREPVGIRSGGVDLALVIGRTVYLYVSDIDVEDAEDWVIVKDGGTRRFPISDEMDDGMIEATVKAKGQVPVFECCVGRNVPIGTPVQLSIRGQVVELGKVER